ncbi:hypothetical protein [Amycolatopsis sp. cmx-4-68]|uniref:hypothetical protein n=1 Tax=Amycolatopsis sp. cmx-4-68 TaxID=2790938 RepID=UPI00397DA5BB
MFRGVLNRCKKISRPLSGVAVALVLLGSAAIVPAATGPEQATVVASVKVPAGGGNTGNSISHHA